MKSKTLLVVFLLFSAVSFSQQLTLKSGGKIYDSNNQKLSNAAVKEILAAQPELLAQYNQGRTKAAAGGFLLGFGVGLLGADLVTGITQDKIYPTAITYIGLASTIIAIPVLIGHSKKIKKAIDGYNESLLINKTGFNVEKINVITNQNGIGMRISF
ncbi:hypothetical protein [Flavobacterium caseinilyticum]|uniref:DUF4199 domain-containing protein n=1 Tax=Flavobacterium caseinilyticum TaxID=2541732 RepID=A0A4R5AS47_9FLAO|nr:hypothetical protein [Flavobacterium caseinilyticum]TDD75533.1 hypothetical protein E0F89_11620 [Flavobacterium caseinilyticum]